MGRWDNYNDVEYKGWNLSRRDLFETICFDNAYHTLEYIKHFYNTKKCKDKPYVHFKRLYNFLEFLYDDKEDLNILKVDEGVAEDFMYHMADKVCLKEVYVTMCKLSCFYDYLIINGLVEKNPFMKVKKLSGQADRKSKQLSTNFITDEQIEKIKNNAPLHLKTYAMFSLSSGADVSTIQNLKWKNIIFDKRMVQSTDEKFFFNEYVSELLQAMRDLRIKKGLDDCGYVFRSHIDANCNKKTPLTKTTIGEWCTRLGEIIGVPNLRHLDFRHTAIRRFLSASGSVGMTSVIMNHKYLSTKARQFIVEENNDDLLQEYKDLCKI